MPGGTARNVSSCTGKLQTTVGMFDAQPINDAFGDIVWTMEIG